MSLYKLAYRSIRFLIRILINSFCTVKSSSNCGSIHYILVLLKATASCATLLKRIYWEGWQKCTPCSNEYSWKRSKSIWGKENYSSIEGMQLNEYPLREAIFVICKWSSTNPFIQTITVNLVLLICKGNELKFLQNLDFLNSIFLGFRQNLVGEKWFQGASFFANCKLQFKKLYS